TVPFEGESAVSIALKHFQSPIPSLREFDSRLPQPLENVVLKATAKEPRHRYATVDEMKADLLTALSPSRRNEPKFMPPAEDEEDTIVLDANAIKEEENQKVTAAVNDETIQVSDENGNSESNKSPKKKRRWLWLLIPLILVGVFLAFILQRPAEVIIPEELIGMTEDEAIEYLEEISLAVGEIHEQPNDEYEEGLIFRVNPNTGATVLEGAEIDLYVSQGEEPFVLEDYTDQNFDEVRAILDEAGFTVESETDTSEEVSEGDIISQDIESGEEVIPSETTITFTVSEGRPSFRMADLIEYSRKGVQDYATRWNLNLTVEEAPSEDVPAGLVMAQEPAEGAPLYAGDHISVVFSTGPEEVQTTTFVREITIPYEENQSDSEGEENEDEVEREPDEIQIFIDDFEHTYDEPARELSITEETTIEQIFIVEEGETARYKVTRNGEDLFEETVRP
ncbi:MAG TPA: PASTA domain-containing protein, partial [Atopostipes sp.]|nr:PASTA domain-containing protein [Atopostipes sp.]